jgi:hypothetical protein
MNGNSAATGSSATWIWVTRVWIPIAAALFTVALAVSAVVLPELRLLHVLQALIYVAIVILARRNSMWAIGAGLTIAVVWNSLNLFVTHNMQRGLTLFWSLLQTGQMPPGPHPIVPMMVLLGGIGHFVLIGAWPLCSIEDSMTRSRGRWWPEVYRSSRISL